MKHYSRNSGLGSVFSESFNRKSRDLLTGPVFAKGDVNCVDILPTITREYKSRVHSSTKLTPIQASFKKNEGFVYHNLLDN